MEILTLGKIKKLKDALEASELNTAEQIAIVNQALTHAIDVDVANALSAMADDLALTQAAVGGDLTAVLSTMDALETSTDTAIAGIPATVQAELSALGSAGYLNVGTGANQVVQLDSSGNLPAVSAQNLTGITNAVNGPRSISQYNEWNNTDGFTRNHTWNKPSWCNRVVVRLVGGGGGGSGHCETGGAGGYSEKQITNPPGSTNVTCGAGARHYHYYNHGGNGGTSSFGGYLSATGGYSANQNWSHGPGYGGHGSSGEINMYGGQGVTSHCNQWGTGGGASYFGGGRSGSHNSSWHGSHAAPGGGGGSNHHGGNHGTAGINGCVIVEEYE